MIFKARLEGHCLVCPEPILVGDNVTWMRGQRGYMHTKCAKVRYDTKQDLISLLEQSIKIIKEGKL